MNSDSGRKFRRRLLAGLCLMPAALALAACSQGGPVRTASHAGPVAVEQSHVTIATPDGTADALLFVPDAPTPAPAVILWAGTEGLRPAFGELGRKLAAEGYVVLAPNAFYRSVKLDGTTVSDVDGRTRFTKWRGSATKEAIGRDAHAYADFLEHLPQVNTAAKLGTVGYNVGSAYAFYTAQALPDRVAAVAIFHPLGTATPRDNSPHLFVKESKASYYVALAADDDQREPGDKVQYREEFAKAKLPATVIVLSGKHGFAVPDNAAYDPTSAAQSWSAMLRLPRAQLH